MEQSKKFDYYAACPCKCVSGGNIATWRIKMMQAERNTVSELVAYLESRGIVLDREAVPRENLGRTVLIVEHNVEQDAAVARILLEDQTLSARMDGVYSASAGEISLKTGGYMEASLTWNGSAEALVSLFGKCGLICGLPTVRTIRLKCKLPMRNYSI